jgi:DHA2 family multidrug resistance protein
MTTFLARRTQLHQSRLAEHVTPSDPATMHMLHSAQAWFVAKGYDQYTAYRKALGALYGMVQRQAAMISFVEAFWVMGVAFLVMLPFLLLLRYKKPEATQPVPASIEQTPGHTQPATQESGAPQEQTGQDQTLVCH